MAERRSQEGRYSHPLRMRPQSLDERLAGREARIDIVRIRQSGEARNDLWRVDGQEQQAAVGRVRNVETIVRLQNIGCEGVVVFRLHQRRAPPNSTVSNV